jgi:hypothetical protein
MACIDTFTKKTSELKTCGGAEATYELYCDVRQNISNVYANDLNIAVMYEKQLNRKNFKPPSSCSAPNKRVRAVLSKSPPPPLPPPGPPCNDPAVKTCWDQCSARSSDIDDACHQSCNAIAAALCEPATDASSTPPNNQRQIRSNKLDGVRTNVKLQQSRHKTTAKSFGVGNEETTKKTATGKNNLDRHDLGPTFVSPDSTSAGRSVRGVATSKSKTSTSSAGTKATISTDAVKTKTTTSSGGTKATISTDAVAPSLSGPTGGFGASAPQQIK